MNTEAAPTSAEFKFNCPTCGQHLMVSTEWRGQQIQCPSCETTITIPSPVKDAMKEKQVLPPSPKTHPAPPGGIFGIEPPMSNSAKVKWMADWDAPATESYR